MNISEEIKKIAEHYGYDAQSNQFIEECAELIQAVNKYKRYKVVEHPVNPLLQPTEEARNKEQIALENLVEEIVDVEIMIEQIKHLLQIPEEEIQAIKLYKVNRTKERL